MIERETQIEKHIQTEKGKKYNIEGNRNTERKETQIEKSEKR